MKIILILLQSITSTLVRPQRASIVRMLKKPFDQGMAHAFLFNTILTQIMADEFNFLWSEIQNYIAEADAD